MLALYIIFSTYFALCLVCSVLVGLWSCNAENKEDENERAGNLGGND